jgi:hypothetical protein
MTNKCAGIIVLAVLAFGGLACQSGAQTGSPSTWKQTGYIKASNAADGDQHGYAIALSGDANTLAVGAPMNSSLGAGVNDSRSNKADDSAFSSGAVYVYVRSGGNWQQQAFIKASNAGANDQFGNAIALSADGNTLAVAAVFEDSAATGIDGKQADNSSDQSGAVYIFTRRGGTWSQQAYVKASNTGEREDGDTFGYTIALSDDGATLAVGAPSEDSNASGINGNAADNSAVAAGAVYVFARAGNTWSQQAYVKTAATRPNSLFGYSVALNNSGDTLAAGAFDEDTGKGALYVFVRQAGAWSQQARLQASNAERGDSLGAWVAISDDGNTVAAAALDEDSFLTGVNPGNQGAADQATDTSAGAAYIFKRAGSAWSQEAFIKASNTGKEDWFGARLALSGDGNTLVVSAPNEDSAAKGIGGKQDDDSAGEAGAAYVYARNGNTWTHQIYAKGANTEQYDEFGSSVALSRDGRMMAVGARLKETVGAVYVFER